LRDLPRNGAKECIELFELDFAEKALDSVDKLVHSGRELLYILPPMALELRYRLEMQRGDCERGMLLLEKYVAFSEDAFRDDPFDLSAMYDGASQDAERMGHREMAERWRREGRD